MSKTLSTALLAHMAQAVTTMTTCWMIVRTDGVTYGFTSFDQDLTVSDQLYQSTSGFSATAIVTHVTGEIDNLDVAGFYSATGINQQDLENGKFDYASIYVFALNWADLSMGICKLRRGYLGECTPLQDGSFQVELRGMTQALVQEFANVWSPLCRADLGDPKCTYPIATLKQTGTVLSDIDQGSFNSTPLAYPGKQLGNVATINFVGAVSAGTALEISDGINTVSVVFAFDTDVATALTMTMAELPGSLDVYAGTGGSDAITITNNSSAQGIVQKSGDIGFGIQITDFTGDYLDNGTLTWTSGQNSGISMEMKTYQVNGQIIYLWLQMEFPIAAGDTFTYEPGCDKRPDTCLNKFDNILNFRAERDMPGPDRMFSYVDAS